MCGDPIVNNLCGCGRWEESNDHPFKRALEEFHEAKQATLTCDAPHLGAAVVFFRGDYLDCKRVEEFILKMKAREHYYD